MPAAKATMAAHVFGKFWEFHDKAFSDAKNLTDANFEKWAGELGLNLEQWRAWMNSQEVQDKVLHDQATVTSMGARGTPAFFINGKY